MHAVMRNSLMDLVSDQNFTTNLFRDTETREMIEQYDAF